MPKHEGKHPDLSGPEFKHLGHFQNPKFVAQGHNQTDPKKLEKEEEDRILREAEASIKRLQEAGFGQEEVKPESVPEQKPEPKPTVGQKTKSITDLIKQRKKEQQELLRRN